jgi:hypothetical protein
VNKRTLPLASSKLLTSSSFEVIVAVRPIYRELQWKGRWIEHVGSYNLTVTAISYVSMLVKEGQINSCDLA